MRLKTGSPHIPTFQWGALMGGVQHQAFNAYQCGEASTRQGKARQINSLSPHPFIPVGCPHGRRSAPGIQRQQNVGRYGTAPTHQWAALATPYPTQQWGGDMPLPHIPVGAPLGAYPLREHIQLHPTSQWGSVFPYPTRQRGHHRGITRGGAAYPHAPVGSTSSPPTHIPVGKRILLPRLLVGVPRGVSHGAAAYPHTSGKHT